MGFGGLGVGAFGFRGLTAFAFRVQGFGGLLFLGGVTVEGFLWGFRASGLRFWGLGGIALKRLGFYTGL